MLMNCMLIHGHSAEDLLASVIASIPKYDQVSIQVIIIEEFHCAVLYVKWLTMFLLINTTHISRILICNLHLKQNMIL